MSGSDGFLKSRWHWLVLAFAGVCAAAAAVYTFGELDADPDDRAAEAASRVSSRIGTAATGVKSADLAEWRQAAGSVKSPAALAAVAAAEGSFLASEKRYHCPSCVGAMAHGEGDAWVCPFCGATTNFVAQAAANAAAVDTDGDGLPDEWEKKYGLNLNDPADAESDGDGDLFTNLEEFEAKTDPTDPRDHPDYLASLTLQLPLQETKLPFLFEKVMKLPSGYRFFFKDPVAKNDYGTRGRSYTPLKGEEIGNTGYIAVGYTEKQAKREIKAAKGEKALKKTVDVSVATVERKSDKRRIDLVVGDRKFVSVDVQAKLVFARGAEPKTFTVVPGDRVELNKTNGEVYKVKELKAVGKGATVKLEHELTGKISVVNALEQ